jgi:predicted nucleotidyltransferase
LGVESLDLFGSRARGDERTDSDLDVLIEYKTSKPFTLYELVQLKRYLEDLTGLTVHVSTRNALRPAHLQQVLKESVNVL